jgi:hypothetical protein
MATQDLGRSTVPLSFKISRSRRKLGVCQLAPGSNLQQVPGIIMVHSG